MTTLIVKVDEVKKLAEIASMIILYQLLDTMIRKFWKVFQDVTYVSSKELNKTFFLILQKK